MEIFDEIRSRVSLASYLGVRENAYVRCPDPTCGSHDKTQGTKERCRIRSYGFHCFYCDLGGSVFDWVMTTRNCGFKEALVHLADVADVSLTPDPERSELLQQVVAAANRYLMTNSEARAYLEETRGLPKSLLFRHQLGYIDFEGEVLRACGVHSRKLQQLGLLVDPWPGETKYRSFYAGYYLFPYRDRVGRVVQIKGRAGPGVNAKAPKSLALPASPKYAPAHWARTSTRDYFYLENELSKARAAGYVLLCEGEIDAHSAEALEYPAVAMPGNYGIEKLARKLEGIARVYDCRDNDAATEKQIPDQAYALQLALPNSTYYRVRLPHYEGLAKVDFNDYVAKFAGNRADFDEMMKSAPSVYSLLCDAWGPAFDEEETFLKLRRIYAVAPTEIQAKMLAKLVKTTGHPREMLAFALEPRHRRQSA